MGCSLFQPFVNLDPMIGTQARLWSCPYSTSFLCLPSPLRSVAQSGCFGSFIACGPVGPHTIGLRFSDAFRLRVSYGSSPRGASGGALRVCLSCCVVSLLSLQLLLVVMAVCGTAGHNVRIRVIRNSSLNKRAWATTRRHQKTPHSYFVYL